MIEKYVPSRIEFRKYEKVLLSGNSLDIKDQLIILNEIRARPYRLTYDESLKEPIDFFSEKFTRDSLKFERRLTIETDDKRVLTLQISNSYLTYK